MGQLKPELTHELYRYLFYITIIMMIGALIQITGITVAELRQAYRDKNFIRIIRNRLSVRLLNIYNIFILLLIYVLKMRALDDRKREMTSKELQEIFIAHPKNYLAFIRLEPIFQLMHECKCYLIVITGFYFINQPPGKLKVAVEYAFHAIISKRLA